LVASRANLYDSTTPQFGQVLRAGSPRNIQLGVRVRF